MLWHFLGSYLDTNLIVTGSAEITGSLSVTGSVTFTGLLSNPDTLISPVTTTANYNSLLIGPIYNSSSITIVSSSILKII